MKSSISAAFSARYIVNSLQSQLGNLRPGKPEIRAFLFIAGTVIDTYVLPPFHFGSNQSRSGATAVVQDYPPTLVKVRIAYRKSSMGFSVECSATEGWGLGNRQMEAGYFKSLSED